MSFVDDFKDLLVEQLQFLQEEVKAFGSDETFQTTRAGTSNSPEVLCQHIIGNLHHFIGAELGKTGYVRNREAEFESHGYTRETIVDSLEETKDMIKKVLSGIWNQDLMEPYPALFKGEQISVHRMLMILMAHLDYHRGQINYDRRIEG